MALPTSFNRVTVIETYLDFSGQAGTGTVLFEPVVQVPSGTKGSGFLKSQDTNILIVPKSIKATLDQSGSISVELPYTNDPDVVPQYIYHVTEEISGVKRQYDISLDSELVGPVWLSQLAPVGVITPGSTALTKELADQYYAPLSAGTISIADNSITTPKLEDLAVTTEKLADDSITGVKIAALAVGTTELSDLSVTSDKLGDSSVVEAKYAPSSLPTTAIKDLAITTGKVADGAITTVKLLDGAVNSAKILDGSVNTSELADGSVTNAKLGSGSVTTAKLGDTSVTNAKLADGSVDSVKLGTSAVTNTKLADGSVTTGKLADGAVTESKVVNGSITAGKLAESYLIKPPSLVKGDLFVYDGSSIVRLPVGTNGYVLSSNSTTSTGLQWIPAPSGGSGNTPLITPDQFGAKGDMVVCTASITSGSNQATITGYTLQTTDVGKLIAIGQAHTNDTAYTPYGHLGQISAVNTSTNVASITFVGGSGAKNANITRTNVRTLIGTDDKTAINAAASYLSGLPMGGKLVGREGAFYMINQSLLAKDKVSYEINGASRYDGEVHITKKSWVVPGFVHGDALDITNPNCYPYAAVNDIAEHAVTITPTNTSDTFWSSLSVGMVIGVRSVEYSTILTITTIPHLTYFTRILAIDSTTKVLTVADPAPFRITSTFGGGAYVFRTDPRAVAIIGATTWVVQRGGLRNCIVDARFPVWGGGAYEWDIENVSPPLDTTWYEVITLNSMSHGKFHGIPRGRFSYTALEPKLGCGWLEIYDMDLQWYDAGFPIYSPCSIGESSHNIDIHHVDISLPVPFANSNMMFMEIYQAKRIRVKENTFRHGGGAIDSVIAVAPTTKSEPYVVDDLQIENNTIIAGASGTTGCARVFKISQVTSGNEAAQTRHKNISIKNNLIKGSLRTDVNEWLAIQCVDGMDISGNDIQIPGAQAALGGRLSGNYDLGSYAGSNGFASPIKVCTGYLSYTNNSGNPLLFGQILPNRAFIIAVTVIVTTAFDGTGTNAIDIGHNAFSNVFVGNAPAGTVQVLKYEAGQPVPTAGGTYGSGLGQRLGSMGATSQRRPQAIYKGTSPTQGAAMVLIEYLPGTPDR